MDTPVTRHTGERRVGVLHALAGLIVIYLALPLGAFVVRFATSSQRGFGVPGLYASLWMSVSCATISLVIATLLGVPLAFVLARSQGAWATIVGVVVQIPLALPPLMSGIVLIYVIGPYTFLGRLFNRELTNSRAGIVIAMTFVAAPFLIVAARAAFTSLDQGLLDVAHTLGHSPTSQFLRVAVPTAGPTIRAGMLLTWLRAFGEYGAVVVLAYNPTSLPIYTYNQFSGEGLSTTLAPTALAIAVAVGAVVLSRVAITPRRTTPRASTPRDVVGDPARYHVAPQHLAFHAEAHAGSFHVDLAHGDVRHLAVVGASGSGKSLLLRCLAGVTGTARVTCTDEDLTATPVSRRPVGYVAQGFNLFSHLTVWQQLMFARRATPEVAQYWCERLQLTGLEGRRPSELSGGQRQRVALAQALCNSPSVLLLDEPFSALDAPVRRELQRLLRRLQRVTGLATVLVTHDADEAALLAEDIVILEDGHQLQSGTVREVWQHPASATVARFVGLSNVFAAVVATPHALEFDGALVPITYTALATGTAVTCCVGPDDVSVLPPSRESAPPRSLRGRVTDIADVGNAFLVFVSVADVEIHSRTHDVEGLEIGADCEVAFGDGRVHFWLAARDASSASDTTFAGRD
jgi:molybdate transport system permease protein